MEEKVSSYEIHGTDIRQLVLKQAKYIREINEPPVCILVGPKQLQNMEQQVAIHCDTILRRNHGYSFYGLKIILVPWMDGTLVLPSFKEWSEINF